MQSSLSASKRHFASIVWGSVLPDLFLCDSMLCQNLPCFLRPFSFVPKFFDAGVRLSVLEDIVEYRCELNNLQIRAFLFSNFYRHLQNAFNVATSVSPVVLGIVRVCDLPNLCPQRFGQHNAHLAPP